MIKEMKKKIITLRDTRGNVSFALRIVFPNKDYKPKISKQEKNRQHVKQYYEKHPDKLKEHYQYIKNWRKRNQHRIKKVASAFYQNNKERYKEYARIWYTEHGKQYYEDNKPRILKNQRDSYHRNKKQEGYSNVKSGSKRIRNIIRVGDVIINECDMKSIKSRGNVILS